MRAIKYISIAMGIASAVLIGFLIGRRCPQNEPVEPLCEKTDTLYVCDTICVSKPIYVETIKLDSVLVPVIDTLRMQDTLFVYLEREQIQWRDSLCMVYASGINPQVDSVTHFTMDKVITREIMVPVKVRSRWGVGVQAGYGAGKDGLSPYFGVGISYNLLSW